MKIVCHLDDILNRINMENKTLSKLTNIRENTIGEMRRNVNKTFSRENLEAIIQVKELGISDINQIISISTTD